MAVGLMIFLISSMVMGQENDPVEVTGEMIYAEGFPSGESFFVRSRSQEENLNYVLENVVSRTVYNDLGEEKDQVQQDLILRDEEVADLKNTLKITWIAVGGVVVGTVIGVLIMGVVK